jgi:transcription elongation factor Elf1
MPYKDVGKRKEVKKKNYSKNRKKVVERVKERKIKIRKWFNEYKEKLSCLKCGENHPATIDFHHLEEKDHQVTHMVHYGYSIEKIKKEMDKCQVLCANCHRKLHWENR